MDMILKINNVQAVSQYIDNEHTLYWLSEKPEWYEFGIYKHSQRILNLNLYRMRVDGKYLLFVEGDINVSFNMSEDMLKNPATFATFVKENILENVNYK